MVDDQHLDNLLKDLNPRLADGEYVFCCLPNLQAIKQIDVVMIFVEKEGITAILSKGNADHLKLKYNGLFSWITLEVYSSLTAIGLTAAVSSALSAAGISCNVVAGYHHDHLFVESGKALQAISVLNQLSVNENHIRKLNMMTINWQPQLMGTQIELWPLEPSDFDRLHLAASDPLIWVQHPDRYRYKKEVFTEYFNAAIKSQGALLILDKSTQEVIGCSRFHDYDSFTNEVFVGYTFLIRRCWGSNYNKELKQLMLSYAFSYTDTVRFLVGQDNTRGRKSVEKIGGNFTGTGDGVIFYEIRKASWNASLL